MEVAFGEQSRGAFAFFVRFNRHDVQPRHLQVFIHGASVAFFLLLLFLLFAGRIGHDKGNVRTVRRPLNTADPAFDIGKRLRFSTLDVDAEDVGFLGPAL